jgi:hypothetical protein
MSRRITVFVLAASAALIASPAFADRECFENSCRLPPAATEPPPAAPSPEPQAGAAPDEAQPALARHDAALPKVVPSSPMPAVVQAKAPRQSGSIVPVAVEARQQPREDRDAVETALANHDGGERVAIYRTNRGVAPGGAAIAEVPGAVYSPAPAPFYPYAQPDPAWRSCQVEGQSRGVVYCGPTSYHPYGEYGYRPNGTYAAYRSPPIYAVAPNAKIITIETND